MQKDCKSIFVHLNPLKPSSYIHLTAYRKSKALQHSSAEGSSMLQDKFSPWFVIFFNLYVQPVAGMVGITSQNVHVPLWHATSFYAFA